MGEKYSEKLKDPRWQKKRLEILERDEWMCQRCFDSESTLHVHHKNYLPQVEPWDYPNGLLITLCEGCHDHERTNREIVEGALLGILRYHFSADDLDRINIGFQRMVLPHAPEVTASVIEWTLSNEELLRELTDRFFKDIGEKLHAEKPTT
jgi:hypothetical protein